MICKTFSFDFRCLGKLKNVVQISYYCKIFKFATEITQYSKQYLLSIAVNFLSVPVEAKTFVMSEYLINLVNC